ncbi:MAG: hypothetical protein ITD36_03580 [Nitrospira sp.]|nr:hypothetical protein [Nitrospira sp.]MBP0121160.1 hypothetical protein [Nitrospira sp.]MBP0123496.1 hypothetical protein [Nitrospira sp.]MBP0127123.1 hypothetical protein [Nitrospira sp.]MBP0129275.1 hypothetical protein [Nitrospira sp.]
MILPSPSSPVERPHKPSFSLVLLCLLCAACTTTDQRDRALIEDPRGAVALRRMPDQSVQASHPINLEPALIARVLSGMQIQERQRTLQELLAGSSSVPVFSAEEVQFLAPRIIKALTTASTGETVSFQITSPQQNSGRLEHAVIETTTGSLYAYGLSLYVTLAQYRHTPTQTNTDGLAHRRLPDPSNLSNRTLSFTPRLAQRSDTFNRPTGGSATDRFLVIDYQLLQQTPPVAAAATTTEPPAPQVEQAAQPRKPLAGVTPAESPSHAAAPMAHREMEIRTLKDLVVKKDLELETIRKELQTIREQLDSRKRKSAPLTPRQSAP